MTKSTQERTMLAPTDKLETTVRAALIVRDESGELMEPQPTCPIPVDADSVLEEVRRLRRMFGRRVSIDSSMILAARQHMAAREAALHS